MARYFIRPAAALVLPAAALLLVLVSQAAAASVRPAGALPCQATVSNAHPADHTTVYVHVHTVSHAGVTTIAHFKTVSSQRHHRANLHGRTTLSYDIGGATAGYRVKVTVEVRSGALAGSCATSFTPHN